MKSPKIHPLLASLAILAAGLSPAGAEEPPLAAGAPVVLPGTTGKFDFLAIDAKGRRLLAGHPGNSSLEVIDLQTKTLLKTVPTGAAQSSAVDLKSAQYLVGVSKPPQLAIVDAGTLAVTGKVPLSGPADIIAMNQHSGLVYIGHDDEKELWVVDPKEKKIVTTVTLPSDAPEDLAFDASFTHLFQNMKTASVVLVIDPATNKVTQSWPTAPAQAPHGLALDAEAGTLLVAGGNGQLVMMSQTDGKVAASVAIPERVDQIAFDPAAHRLYCASGTGKIAVIGVEKEKLSRLGEVPCPAGTHSIAVDPLTHEVWIAYAAGKESFAQPFTPKP